LCLTLSSLSVSIFIMFHFSAANAAHSKNMAIPSFSSSLVINRDVNCQRVAPEDDSLHFLHLLERFLKEVSKKCKLQKKANARGARNQNQVLVHVTVDNLQHHLVTDTVICFKTVKKLLHICSSTEIASKHTVKKTAMIWKSFTSDNTTRIKPVLPAYLAPTNSPERGVTPSHSLGGLAAVATSP